MAPWVLRRRFICHLFPSSQMNTSYLNSFTFMKYLTDWVLSGGNYSFCHSVQFEVPSLPWLFFSGSFTSAVPGTVRDAAGGFELSRVEGKGGLYHRVPKFCPITCSHHFCSPSFTLPTGIEIAVSQILSITLLRLLLIYTLFGLSLDGWFCLFQKYPLLFFLIFKIPQVCCGSSEKCRKPPWVRGYKQLL